VLLRSLLRSPDDAATVTVIPTTGLNTTEAGGTAVFTVVLNQQTSANVTIPLSSTDTGEGTLSSSSITFGVGQWDVPQTVTVTGVHDARVDGNIAFNIETGALNSSDTNFNGAAVADVWGVINMDGWCFSRVDCSFVRLSTVLILLFLFGDIFFCYLPTASNASPMNF
jgi:hypothetical protein